jgi:hypothetical protein
MIAGAFHGVFDAQLRGWLQIDDHREAFVNRLDEIMRFAASAMSPLLESDHRPARADP